MNLLLPSETPEQRRTRIERRYWLPTQEAWIKTKSRLKLMEKCRRFGGSYAEAFSTVEDTGMAGQPFDAWVGSRDLLAARLFVNDCKKFSRMLNLAATDNGEVFLEDGERDLRAFELEFANDRLIRALSSSPDAFAGKQGRFRLDEFALHKDPRQLYSIVQPALIRGGSLGIISTHRGSQNFFNELVREIKEKGNKKRFKLFTVTIEDAVREGLWVKIQQTLRAAQVEDERLGWSDDEFLQSLRDECATEEAWLQEYMCQPCDDSSALLTWEELIAASLTKTALAQQLAEIPADAPRYVGMDIGRHNHPSVLWQWVKWRGLFIEEKIVPMHKMPFAQQETILYAHLDAPNVHAACVDQTGLGMQLAENALARYPGKVKPITFNPQIKLVLAANAKRKFQDRVVRIADEPRVQYELYSIKQKSGSSDNIVITSEAGSLDGHADYAWAGFLGLHAAEQDGGPFHWQAIRPAAGAGSRLGDLVKSAARRAGRLVGMG